MPRREGHRDERAHRVRDDDDRAEPERGRHCGEIVGVPRHPGGPDQLVAAAAAAEIRRDDPHVRQFVGQQFPREVRRRDTVDREDRRRRVLVRRLPLPSAVLPPPLADGVLAAARVTGIPHTHLQIAAGDRHGDGAHGPTHRDVHPPSIV